MGLIDVFKSEFDRQRDLRKEEKENLQRWMNSVQDALISMEQTYDVNLGRVARGESVSSDKRALEQGLNRCANDLEKLIARPEADKAEDEFIRELEAVCEKARDVAGKASFGPKFTVSDGQELAEKIGSVREQIE